MIEEHFNTLKSVSDENSTKVRLPLESKRKGHKFDFKSTQNNIDDTLYSKVPIQKHYWTKEEVMLIRYYRMIN